MGTPIANPFSPSAWAVLIYGGWTLALLAAKAAQRLRLVLLGVRRANAFSLWGDDVSPFSARLCRAHAYCVENLPVFGSIVLAAVMLGRTELIDPWALWAVGDRILQSCIHLASVSTIAVGLRFAFMAAQMIIITTMIGNFVLASRLW